VVGLAKKASGPGMLGHCGRKLPLLYKEPGDTCCLLSNSMEARIEDCFHIGHFGVESTDDVGLHREEEASDEIRRGGLLLTAIAVPLHSTDGALCVLVDLLRRELQLSVRDAAFAGVTDKERLGLVRAQVRTAAGDIAPAGKLRRLSRVMCTTDGNCGVDRADACEIELTAEIMR